MQHHHAHIASVMAENGVPVGGRVIGIAFDGTGFGTDGTIWGGEVLVAGYGDFVRVGHLKSLPLPGGDAAIRRPCRTALAHLWAAGIEWAEDLPPANAVSTSERAVLARQLERGIGCVATSSMGRLFDAVSSLLGLRHQATYEAEAALCLQWAAEKALDDGVPALPYRFDLTGAELDPSPVLRALVRDLRRGADNGAMAAGFHAAVAHLIGDAAEHQRARTGIDVVALSGGVFQNALLLGLARRELEARRFRVLTHRVVPPNDGGLALGQAAIAGYRAAAADDGVERDRRGVAERSSDRPRTWRRPRWPWPAGSPRGPPCGAWRRSGPRTPATSPWSSCTRSSWGSVRCRRSVSTGPRQPSPCACSPGPGTSSCA